jgi:hypothetical protein
MKTFKYEWKSGDILITGEYDAENEQDLRVHLHSIGGELVKVLNVTEKESTPDQIHQVFGSKVSNEIKSADGFLHFCPACSAPITYSEYFLMRWLTNFKPLRWHDPFESEVEHSCGADLCIVYPKFMVAIHFLMVFFCIVILIRFHAWRLTYHFPASEYHIFFIILLLFALLDWLSFKYSSFKFIDE